MSTMSRRSSSPEQITEYSVTASATYRSNSNLSPQVRFANMHGGPEVAPPRHKKRGRSLSTTRLDSIERDTPSFAMAPSNPSFGYDRDAAAFSYYSGWIKPRLKRYLSSDIAYNVPTPPNMMTGSSQKLATLPTRPSVTSRAIRGSSVQPSPVSPQHSVYDPVSPQPRLSPSSSPSQQQTEVKKLFSLDNQHNFVKLYKRPLRHQSMILMMDQRERTAMYNQQPPQAHQLQHQQSFPQNNIHSKLIKQRAMSHDQLNKTNNEMNYDRIQTSPVAAAQHAGLSPSKEQLYQQLQQRVQDKHFKRSTSMDQLYKSAYVPPSPFITGVKTPSKEQLYQQVIAQQQQLQTLSRQQQYLQTQIYYQQQQTLQKEVERAERRLRHSQSPRDRNKTRSSSRERLQEQIHTKQSQLQEHLTKLQSQLEVIKEKQASNSRLRSTDGLDSNQQRMSSEKLSSPQHHQQLERTSSANRLSSGNLNRSSRYNSNENNAYTKTGSTELWQSDARREHGFSRRSPVKTIPKTISPMPDVRRSLSPPGGHISSPISATVEPMQSLPEDEVATEDDWYAEEEMPYELEHQPSLDEDEPRAQPFGGRQGAFKSSTPDNGRQSGARTADDLLQYADDEESLMQDYSIMEDLRHDRVKFADDDVHRVDEEQKLREQLEWEAEEEQREREWREEHKRKQMDEELQRQRDSKERDDQERMWQQERIRKIRASEMSKAEEEILTQQQQFLDQQKHLLEQQQQIEAQRQELAQQQHELLMATQQQQEQQKLLEQQKINQELELQRQQMQAQLELEKQKLEMQKQQFDQAQQQLQKQSEQHASSTSVANHIQSPHVASRPTRPHRLPRRASQDNIDQQPKSITPQPSQLFTQPISENNLVSSFSELSRGNSMQGLTTPATVTQPVTQSPVQASKPEPAVRAPAVPHSRRQVSSSYTNLAPSPSQNIRTTTPGANGGPTQLDSFADHFDHYTNPRVVMKNRFLSRGNSAAPQLQQQPSATTQPNPTDFSSVSAEESQEAPLPATTSLPPVTNLHTLNSLLDDSILGEAMMTGRRQTLPDVITALDIEATPPASRASNKSTDAPIAVAIQRKKSLPGNAAAVAAPPPGWGREQVSVLAHAAREARAAEAADKSMFNWSSVKDWLINNQMAICIIVVNLMLAYYFFKLFQTDESMLEVDEED